MIDKNLKSFSNDLEIKDVNSTEETKKEQGSVVEADEIVHVEKTSRYANDFE